MEEIKLSRVFEELKELKNKLVQLTRKTTFVDRDIHTKDIYSYSGDFEKKYHFREKIEDCTAEKNQQYYLKSKIYESVLYIVTYSYNVSNYYYAIRVILTDEVTDYCFVADDKVQIRVNIYEPSLLMFSSAKYTIKVIIKGTDYELSLPESDFTNSYMHDDLIEFLSKERIVEKLYFKHEISIPK